MRQLILVHGLWVPGLVMQPLAARLARAGFRCHSFGYRGRAPGLEAHAERLARYARGIGRASFVGHSLGGLLVLAALEADRAVEVERVVLLGTPARGSAAARRLARHAPGRWMLGGSAERLRAHHDACWSRPEPLGVLAGTLPFGLGRVIGRLPGANDGVVCVEETAVRGMSAQALVHVGHSAMLVSSRVARLVAGFLLDGRFPADSR